MNIHLKALSRSTIASISLITILTVWGEKSPGLKDFLKSVSGHHWVTKGIFSLILFVGLYFILAKYIKDNDDVKKETMFVVGSTVIGGSIIFVFYMLHFYGVV